MTAEETPRKLAARVVERVLRKGAFAAAVLQTELSERVQLEPRDKAFATELTYGTLRLLPWLTGEIARFATRGTDKLDPRVQAHLVVAVYQLYFTRVPAFAAVSQAVDAVRATRGDKMAAFANAVLRKVAERASHADDALRSGAFVASTPAWLRTALERSLGERDAHAMLATMAETPAATIRVERAESREQWLERFRQAAPEASFEAGRWSPLAIVARGAGRLSDLPGWSEGAFTIQEEGSQLAALSVGAGPGDTVLDACAGRGNKTGLLARAVEPGGAVDACDASPSKLERLVEELARLGLAPRATYGVDWTAGCGDVTGTYDRVLVDAPCTGVGTLGRHPEIALRLKQEDVADRSSAQRAILGRAASRVRKGGSLVYVVCSVLREEAEDVVEATLADCPDLSPADFDAPAVKAAFGTVAVFRLLPHVHRTDGYFVARLGKSR